MHKCKKFDQLDRTCRDCELHEMEEHNSCFRPHEKKPETTTKWNVVGRDLKTGGATNLPENCGEYLFSFSDGTVRTDTLTRDVYGAFLWDCDIYKVTAWMPLPEAYKPE